MFKKFLSTNQVFLSGLLTAVAMSLQQVFQPNTPFDWKVIGFAVLMAVLSFIGNQFRGKGVSVAGMIGVLAISSGQVLATGHFTWNNFIQGTVLALVTLVLPPIKPASYEKSAVIMEAKKEAEVITKKVDADPKLP